MERLTLFLCSVSEKLIREQKNMKIEYRHLWINTVNDWRYEIKFENRVKDTNSSFY